MAFAPLQQQTLQPLPPRAVLETFPSLTEVSKMPAMVRLHESKRMLPNPKAVSYRTSLICALQCNIVVL